MLFTKDVLKQFVSKDTGMKQKKEAMIEMPAITICLKDNKTYEYGTDLNISVNQAVLDISDKDSDYNENLNYLDYDDDTTSVVILEKIYSWIDENDCFKITRPNDQVFKTVPKQFDIRVKFNLSISEEDLPDIEVFFTSVENAYGIIFREWIDGIEMKQEFHKVHSILYSMNTVTKKLYKLNFHIRRRNGCNPSFGLNSKLYNVYIWKKSQNVVSNLSLNVMQT